MLKFHAVGLYVLAFTFVIACRNDIGEIKRVTDNTQFPSETVVNARITYSDSGRTSFIIEAGQIDRFLGETPHDEFTNGVRVISYDKHGEIESEITADHATNYPEEKIMVAKDSVVLKDSEGKQLNTELLTWDENTAKIYTDKFVRIKTPTEILFGDGLEADQDFSYYEIKNIKGRIKIDEDE